MDYKVYREDNYIVIDEIGTAFRHEGACEDVTIYSLDQTGKDFVFRGFRDFDKSLPIESIKKEDGTDYTSIEFIDFCRQNTGLSPDGGGGMSSAEITGPLGQRPVAESVSTVLAAGATPANFNLEQIGGDGITLGQKTSAGSFAVVLPSDQSPISTKTNDGSGNPISSTTNVAGQRGLNVDVQGTIFDFSTVNSTSTQLTASGTFNGVIESVVNQQAYSVLFFSDQNATITIKQYSDAAGLKLAQQLVFTYTANQPFARSGVLNGNYVQIIVQNTGASTTTLLRLDTAYGTIPSATQLNNAPMSLEEVAGTAISLGQKTEALSIPVVTPQDAFITGQGAQTVVGQNIVLATAGTTPTDCIGYRSIAIQINPTGTVTSGVVTFEGSNDITFPGNGFPVFLYDDNSQSANPVSTVSPATGVSRGFSGPIKYRYFRARITTVIGGGGSVQAITTLRQVSYQPTVYTVTQATAGNLNVTSTISSLVPGTGANNLGKAEDTAHTTGDVGVFVEGVRSDALAAGTGATGRYGYMALSQYNAQLVKGEFQHARTYSATGQFTPATTASDVFVIPGNATSTVYITKIIISGTATAARQQDVLLIRRSAANTGGTATTASIGQHDSTDTANVSLPIYYTANPSALGTGAGFVRRAYMAMGTSATTTSNAITFDFGSQGRPLVVRGTAQILAVSLSGTATLAGDSIDISVEWFEI